VNVVLSRRKFLLIVGGTAASFLLGCAAPAPKPTPTPVVTPTPGVTPTPTPTPKPKPKITLPALFDQSGPTSDVGVDYAYGAENAAKWINEKEGGIPGIGEFKLVGTDYAYKIPEAVSIYERYKSTYRPAVIIGWGTGDTEALSPTIAKDKIVYISASYSSHLDNPKKTPYNFYPICSYSDQLRAGLMWFKEYWEKEGENRPPRVCFCYMFVCAYCRAPIAAGKALASELGFQVGPDQDISLRATDTSSQVLAMKDFGADLVWMGNTTASTAVLAKDMKKLGLDAILLVNQWGHDENLIKLAGEAAEGVHGMTGHYYWGFEAEAPGLKTLRKSIEEYGPKDHFPISSYMRGWLNVRMAVMAIGETYEKYGEVTGEKVKATLEAWKDKDLEGGICPPVTFTSDDHRPSTKAIVLKIENGKYTKASDWIDVTRNPKYLGW
jgi:branched-chain amino acid transport system substrate-binding protein